ncbi:sorting nexin-22 [Protopterus annectens]|uniref:sorting nexin-22 n=1 Tax=Protopterus annectens TaxID=7888 RepID=UPI001CFAF369|nr:sorting nexin-22 [Protopterus annectens]
MIAVCIPFVGQQVHGESQKKHTVFKVEVLTNGRKHVLNKRFKEFRALHRKIKKTCQVPEFPPKRLSNWGSKEMEHKRLSLEVYIQGVLAENQNVPAEVLEFLSIRQYPTERKASTFEDSMEELSSLENSFRLMHKPVVGFHSDPFAQSSMAGTSYSPEGISTDYLPDIVVEGVLQGLYMLNANLSSKVYVTPNGE